MIHLYQQAFGPEPLLDRLFDMRVTADNEIDRFRASADEISRLITDVTSLLERCRVVATTALDAGPDEPDPPPDH